MAELHFNSVPGRVGHHAMLNTSKHVLEDAMDWYASNKYKRRLGALAPATHHYSYYQYELLTLLQKTCSCKHNAF